jgi:hypothetical protein
MARARMGRPPKPKADRAAKLLGVQFTNAERRELEAAAKLAGESLSEWARNLLLSAALQAAGEEHAMNTTSNVPNGARTTEYDRRRYWMEQTRGEPRPQIAVVDAESGEIQGYFYPIRPGFPHVAHQPYTLGDARQSEIVGVIANRFDHGI